MVGDTAPAMTDLADTVDLLGQLAQVRVRVHVLGDVHEPVEGLFLGLVVAGHDDADGLADGPGTVQRAAHVRRVARVDQGDRGM
jgi:hypothetical protein